MILTISKEGYTEKFTDNYDYSNVVYTTKRVNNEQFITYIKTGHLFNKHYTDDEFCLNGYRFSTTFIDADYMFIDVDDAEEETLDELINKLSITPFYAYTTFSHKVKGNRYRLVYLFNRPVEEYDEYRIIYDFIVDKNNLSLTDDCGRRMYQNMWGTNSTNEYFEEYRNDSYIDVDEILEDSYNTRKYQLKSIIEREETLCNSLDTFDANDEFINDYFTLSHIDFLNKYSTTYHAFESTPLEEVDDDTPIITLPNNYIVISRKVMYGIDKITGESYTKPKLIKDGEGRKRILFMNGVLRRWMLPTISFNHLLYCLVYELYHYIDNREDHINKKTLFGIAKRSYEADHTKYSFKRDKRKYIVNQRYCIKYNLTKKQVSSMNQQDKQLKLSIIPQVYDLLLTQKENLDIINNIMVEDGLSPISVPTFKRYLKELGITKYKKQKP